MTTYFPLTPSTIAPPTFQATLDGAAYTCTVTWNLFAQRFYLNCFDSSGNLIFTVAIVETAPTIPLSELNWDPETLQVTVTTSQPHGFPIGLTTMLTITDVSPAAYNGAFQCYVTGPNMFRFDLAEDPGQEASSGLASFLVSLCKGYFDSTIVYRNGQFEVSP